MQALKQRLQSIIRFVLRYIPHVDAAESDLDATITDAAVAFIMRVIAVGSSFGLSVILARLVGSEGVGLYYQGLAIVSIVAVVAELGFSDVILRFGTTFAAKDQWHKFVGLKRKTLLISVSVAIALAGALLLLADPMATYLFDAPTFSRIIRLFALATIPLTLTTLYSMYFRALEHIELSLLSMTFAPVLTVLGVLVLVPIQGVQSAALAYLCAQTGLWLLLMLAWRKQFTVTVRQAEAFDTRQLFAVATPLLMVAAFNIITERVNVLLLGIWLDDASVGIFAVAYRLATLINLVLLAFNIVIPPRFAVLYEDDNTAALAKLVHEATRIMALVGLLISLPLLLAPQWFMGIYGAEFRSGAFLLVIMVIGQFMNVISALAGRLLVMTGHEKLFRNNVIFFSIFYVAINLVLIPTMGLIGAAYGVTIGLVVKNLISVYLVRKHVNISI